MGNPNGDVSSSNYMSPNEIQRLANITGSFREEVNENREVTADDFISEHLDTGDSKDLRTVERKLQKMYADNKEYINTLTDPEEIEAEEYYGQQSYENLISAIETYIKDHY